ncbi:MAG: hypothetical protein PGN33_19965 [Methylobacterium radiotolerans]
MDTIKQFFTDLMRLSKLRADSLELHRVRQFAKRQESQMDDVAHDGRNARPPEGDDWNELAARLGIFEEEGYQR